MQHFFLKLIAPRPSFAFDMTEGEKELMDRHLRYWKARQDQGEVLVFGPVMDPNGPYGMGVIAAVNEKAARTFSEGDPAMLAGAGFRCEIYPMRAVTRETLTV